MTTNGARAVETFMVDTTSVPVSVRYHPPATATDRFIVLAPGAGANLDQPFLQRLCADAAEADFGALRMNFPYRERGVSSPDRPAVLEATWRAVIAEVRARFDPAFLAVGGRSMGGRIASMVVASGEPVSALLLLAYPLRSPSGKGADRTAHLPSIAVPTLFISGTRDQLAPIEALREATTLIRRSILVVLEGADHGFAAPKAAEPGTAELDRRARNAAIEFLIEASTGTRE